MKAWAPHAGALAQPSLPGVFSPQRARRLATPHEMALDVALRRLSLLMLGFICLYLLIAGRLAMLTLVGHEARESAPLPASQDGAAQTITTRADITDRNGITLATSVPTVSLCADGRSIINADDAAKALAEVLPDMDVARLREDLKNARNCSLIKRHLTPRQQSAVNALGIAGLEFRDDERRVYPNGNLAAHIVGYTDIDNNGLAGIEKKLDRELEESSAPAALSIDIRLQEIMRREILSAMDAFHAEAAGGLIMDIKTGEILSLVSLPDFDPQHPAVAGDEGRFNRDTLGVYEMGSTFKIFTTAMALDSGLVRVTDTFDTTHPIIVGKQTIRDFHPENHALNVGEIFAHSSNLGAARMAERCGAARLKTFFERVGLGTKPSLEIPEVGAPLLPEGEEWSQPSMLTASFGHGIAVNAVQLASAVAAVVNDGHTIQPTLLKRPETGFIADSSNSNTNPVVTPRTSAEMRALMRLVVTRGTAKSAEAKGYMLGGKTGTANKLDAHHHYRTDARLASFVGVFPINAPRYLVFAMLDNPQGNKQTAGYATGGWVAAPAVGKIVSQIGPLLGIMPLSPEQEMTAEKQMYKSLGALSVDGTDIDEEPYAPVATRSFH